MDDVNGWHRILCTCQVRIMRELQLLRHSLDASSARHQFERFWIQHISRNYGSSTERIKNFSLTRDHALHAHFRRCPAHSCANLGGVRSNVYLHRLSSRLHLVLYSASLGAEYRDDAGGAVHLWNSGVQRRLACRWNVGRRMAKRGERAAHGSFRVVRFRFYWPWSSCIRLRRANPRLPHDQLGHVRCQRSLHSGSCVAAERNTRFRAPFSQSSTTTERNWRQPLPVQGGLVTQLFHGHDEDKSWPPNSNALH